MPTIAELTIKVNTTDLDRANASLDKVSKTAQKTSTTVDQAADEFSKLRAEIDPAAAAMDRLNRQQDRLKMAFARSGGNIPTDEYTRLNSMIEQSRKRIGDLGAQTGKTAKEINFAMRGLPAQFTDIFVSLQGGQAPLTVFLQQGGQIKDMFGGIGPAFRAMGGYVLSLINPLSVAAAAMGTLAVGFVLGAKESSSFNKALIASGNAAGTTASNLLNLTEQLDNNLTTSGKAAQVLNQIAASGKITEASFGRVAEAAIRWEKATGTATDETVKAFAKIKEDPVKAVEELDDKYNLLTGSVYKQIEALQEQGDKFQAAQIVEKLYADTLIERSREIGSNLGLVERGWNFVAEAAKKGWDAILDVGRDTSPQKKLSDAFSLLTDYEAAGQTNSATYKKIVAQVKLFQEEIANAESKALFARIDKQIKDNSVAGQKLVNATLRDAEKEKSALAELDKAVADARRDGVVYSEEQIGKAREVIRKKYEEKGPRKRERVVREDAAKRLLATLEQQGASLQGQLASEVKLTTEQQKMEKLVKQISQAEEKAKQGIATLDQQSLIRDKEKLLTQQQKNVDIQKELVAQKELARLEALKATLAQQIETRRQGYEDAEIGAGLSDKQTERLKQRLQLQRQYNTQQAQLYRDFRNQQIGEDVYQKGIEALKTAQAEELRLTQEHNAKMDAIQGDWTVGASKAWENYKESAKDVSGMTQSLFTNAFTGMEDALVGFVTTGKLSFKDLTVSILSDLARMATRIAANQILMSIIGSFMGGISTTATSSVGTVSTSATTINTGSSFANLAADGRAYSGGSEVMAKSGTNAVQYFANGGTFTNSVVSTPTAFNTGSGLGIMGEAGPEAIMPLTRTSDGQLGVKAVGGGGSSVLAPVSVSVTMSGGMSGAQGADTNTESQGRAIQNSIKQVCDEAISKALMPGGRIWLSQNGR